VPIYGEVAIFTQSLAKSAAPDLQSGASRLFVCNQNFRTLQATGTRPFLAQGFSIVIRRKIRNAYPVKKSSKSKDVK